MALSLLFKRYELHFLASCCTIFLNLSLDADKCGKKELFRAIEENAAFVTLGNLQLIENLTGIFPSEVVFAGGAAKGKLYYKFYQTSLVFL